jgi:DNA-binding XRE family transcriptional regulator
VPAVDVRLIEYLPGRHHRLWTKFYDLGVDNPEDFDKGGFLKRLGTHIAKVRRSKGYSQDRTCLEAGLARGTLSKIENGLVEPKISTLALVAITVGVPLKKLTDVEL